MTLRISYVLGGPIQDAIEIKKRDGEQPLSEFNTFVRRNGARLVATDQVTSGSPTSLRRRIALARLVARNPAEYDVVVTSGEDIGFPLALLSLAQRVRKPIWIILHGSYLEGRKFSVVAPMLRRARHVHFMCLSDSLRLRMIGEYGFPAERCHNAGYGVDTSFFHPSGTVTTPMILAAGSANRDYRTLVSAVEDIDVPVRVAAYSLWRPKAAELDATVIPAHVAFGSAGDYIALRALYARASFVVVPLHPARYASGYAVIAEAMAMGKAVITSRTDAPSDLMVEGETGFYTEPGDVAGLRDRIMLLLGDPERARIMGEAGAKRMQNEFGLDSYCEKIEALVGAR